MKNQWLIKVQTEHFSSVHDAFASPLEQAYVQNGIIKGFRNGCRMVLSCKHRGEAIASSPREAGGPGTRRHASDISHGTDLEPT